MIFVAFRIDFEVTSSEFHDLFKEFVNTFRDLWKYIQIIEICETKEFMKIRDILTEKVCMHGSF